MDDRGGSIVNVASETAFTGSHGFAHYVASKGAVISLTRALANEMGKKNIRVNCIAPGRTTTPGSEVLGEYDISRTPLGRLMRPDDLLGTFCYFLSDDSGVRVGPDDHRQRRPHPELMGDLLDDYDATGLADLVARGDVSAVELVEAAIARIEAFDPKLNAVIHRQFDRALREAAGSLPDGPFRGVPILFKDLRSAGGG